MELNRKKYLLSLADSIGKDINSHNCGNYVPKVLNAIEIGKKYNDKKKFKVALENMKKTSFGGNSQKIGYSNFLDNIITKKEYDIENLSFEELEFVFSWVRRIVFIKSKDSNNRKEYKKSNNNRNFYKDKSNHQLDNRINDNPFAVLSNLKFDE